MIKNALELTFNYYNELFDNNQHIVKILEFSDMHDLNESIGNRLISEKIQHDVETIYLSKLCSIERDRVKAIFKSNKHKKTNIISYATTIVIDKLKTNNYKHRYIINYERFLSIKEQLSQNKNLPVDKIQELFDSNQIDMIIANSLPDGLEMSESTKYIYVFNYWGAQRDLDHIINAYECLANPKANFISSKNFDSEFIQAECITIDHEMFLSLEEMAISKDTTNTSFLVNIIDNCNLSESHFYINLLATIHGSLSDKLSQRTKMFLTNNKYNFLSSSRKYAYHNMLSKHDYNKDPYKVDLIKQYFTKEIKKDIRESLAFIFPDSTKGKIAGIDNLEIILKY